MDYIIELYIVEVIVFNEDRCFFSGDCLVVNVVIFVVCVVVVGDFNVIGIQGNEVVFIGFNYYVIVKVFYVVVFDLQVFVMVFFVVYISILDEVVVNCYIFYGISDLNIFLASVLCDIVEYLKVFKFYVW